MTPPALKDVIKTIPLTVIGKPTTKLIQVLLDFLAEDREVCDELADNCALQVLSIIATLDKGSTLSNILDLRVPNPAADDDHISYLKKILRVLNNQLTPLWTGSYGGYTQASQGPRPVPGPDDYTPVLGYEDCTDNELIGLINQFFKLIIILFGYDPLITSFDNLFAGLGKFFNDWKENPGEAALGTIDGILEGFGIYAFAGTISALIVDAALSLRGAPHLPTATEMRSAAADSFWEAVQLLGGSDLRNDPIFQETRQGGETIGQFIAIVDAVQGAYNFTLSMAAGGFDLPPGGMTGFSLGSGDAVTLTWATVAEHANSVAWENGASIVNGLNTAINFFRGQKGGGKHVRGVENNETVNEGDPYKGYAKARDLAIQYSGLGDDAIDYVSELGPNKGVKVVGRQSPDGLRGWRIDYDPDTNDFHVNWWDRTGGTSRSQWLYGRISIEGVTSDVGDAYDAIIKHFPNT